MNPIEQEGYDAAKAGNFAGPIPYFLDSPLFYEWLSGWDNYTEELLAGKTQD